MKIGIGVREVAEKIVDETSDYCGQTCIHIRSDGTYMVEVTSNHRHTTVYLHIRPLLGQMKGMEVYDKGWKETWNYEREKMINVIVNFLNENELKQEKI